MCVCFTRICVLFLSVSLICAEESSENGVSNVLVAFSQNVPADIGTEIVKEMQTTLRKTSEILQNAIGLPFSKVTFEIPESWEILEYDDIGVDESFESVSVKADILIDNTNDTAFGKFPFAQQYGSCGIPGYQIIVPTAFFDELNEFPKGIALAREWLKYKYGVFDENGYHKDELYPLYYYTPGGDPNEVHITDCVNSDVTYNFTDKEGNECPSKQMLIHQLDSEECTFNINEEDLENVHSSLMYFHDSIKSMTDICGKDDDHPHNSRARNKQNVLCNGKSIWDVIQNSSNYNKEDKEHSNVDFFIKKKAKLRVVVAWENTKRMKTQDKMIINAIKKLVVDLPYGSKFRAFPFGADEIDKDYSLREFHKLDDKLISLALLKSDFDEENGNIKAAIEKAISILRAGDENGVPKGNIIIITGSLDNFIAALVKDVSGCVEALEAKIKQPIPENIDELLSSLPCLEMITIPSSDKPEEVYEKLVVAIEEICPSKAEDKLTEMVKIQFIDQERKTLDFETDDLTDAVTLTIFTDRESKNFNLDLDGEKQTEGQWVDYTDVLQLPYPLTKAGTFKLEYLSDITDPMLVEVRKTSKAGKYFFGKVMVLDTTAEDDQYQMPVIIYTTVRFGSYPVQSALVKAIIQRPDGKNISLELKDDGVGDPDITRNDGVYSRYFIDFNGAGEYILKVVVADNGDATKYGVDDNAGYRSCCGSDVKQGTAIPSKFTKSFETTFTTMKDRPENGYKPSRIMDLRIDSVTDDGILLKWTAPGEEADSGTVQSYEIKSFTSPEEAKDNFENGDNLLTNTFSPKERGETEKLNISYSDFEEHGLRYIAMKTKNLIIESDLSTTVEVYIPSKETTDAPDNGGDESGKIKTGKTNPKTIGLIVGLIVGLIILMILIYVVIYFVIVKPKRKKQKTQQKEDKENPIYDRPKRTENRELNPINFVSADTLIKHHNEKVKAKTQNKEPPIFKEEDFENRNVQSTNDSSISSNEQDQESSNKNPRNGQPFPPKSPKRITPV